MDIYQNKLFLHTLTEYFQSLLCHLNLRFGFAQVCVGSVIVQFELVLLEALLSRWDPAK